LPIPLQSVDLTQNGPEAGDGFTTDQTQPGLDRGNSVFDIRHRLTFTYVWESNHGLLAAVLGGWHWNGLWSFQSGEHWSAFDLRRPLLRPRSGFPNACIPATFDPVHCVNEGGDYNLDGESNDWPPRDREQYSCHALPVGGRF
jgi:hypothetical protein